MSERLLVAGVLALLLLAAALLLWQWAARRHARAIVFRHLEKRINTGLGELPGDEVRRDNAGTGRRLADPWSQPAASLPAMEPARSRFTAHMPASLRGAVDPHSLGWGMGVMLAACLTVLAFSGPAAAGGILLLLLLLGLFSLWLRVQKYRNKLVSQLPGFIDAMVRLITIGNSTQSSFQLAAATTKAPLRGYMENANSLIRAGVNLDQALHQMARTVRIEEMYLLAAILGLGVRYGGRADVLLERVANFMRDREQAGHELVAMSSETRLSAWILGLLPVCVGLAIVLLNGSYFNRMWQDPVGQMMIFGALGLQVFGVLLLYRLARID